LGVHAGGADRVAFDRRRVVAERVGDDRHRSQLGQLVQGAEPGRASAEDGLEPAPQAGAVDVPAGGIAAEDPGGG
jgi:hypothetical protein